MSSLFRLAGLLALLVFPGAGLPAATTHARRDFALAKREEACGDLRISTNNGDRKVAIVIDSSGSMSSNDPARRRVDAGRALNDFLISDAEAGGGKTPDKIAVIDFDGSATLLYPLGDPGGANASFSRIDSNGGTSISSGVTMAINQLTSGAGATDKRSAIVVFTDGEDSSTSTLVSAIKKATAAGIRVSFGFLDTSASIQATGILDAVRESRGAYATITTAAGSINFINYVLLNGLTYNDNPQGFDSQLLAGLSQTYTISGTNTVTLRYSATQGEAITFSVVGFAAGQLSSVASMGGSQLNTPVTSSSLSRGSVAVTAPSSGQIELQVTAQNAGQSALFSVTTNSNVPIKNCTVSVGPSSPEPGGLSDGAKAGIGVGAAIAALAMLSAGGFYAYKHFHAPGGISAPPGDGGISAAPQGAGNHTMPLGPNSDGGLAPAAPGQGGIGAPPGGPVGQAPLGGPPPPPGGISFPPMSGGGPPVFVPMFVPPILPGTPNSQNTTNFSPSSPSTNTTTPLSTFPAPSPYSPLMSNPSVPPPHGGFEYPMHPGGIQPGLINGPPPELGPGGIMAPPGHGGLPPGTTPGAPPGYSGGDTGFPPGHGDAGPYNHTGFQAPVATPPPPPPVQPHGPTPPTLGGPSPGGQSQVFVPSSGFGWSSSGRSRKHHHHPWLNGAPCEDRSCPLHSDSHVCSGNPCECTCTDPDCPLNK